MRAAVLRSLGGCPSYDEHPAPAVAPGHALVRVTAAPIVPLDLLCASGRSYFGEPAVPYVPGVQGVAVVERSDRLRPGTRVWFATVAGMQPVDGSMAELSAVPDDDVVPVDGDLSDAHVAAIGLSGVAAWVVLTRRGALTGGEQVLVLGAGGAVGQVAVGAAKLLGAGRVVALCRSPEGSERARSAGADEVVQSAGDVDELTGRLRDVLGGAGADVVVDPLSGIPATAAARVLAEGGRLVNLGASAGDITVVSSAVLRSRSAAVLGYTNNALSSHERNQALTTVLEHAAAGRLGVAHVTAPLADVEEAWGHQRDGRSPARVVLTVP